MKTLKEKSIHVNQEAVYWWTILDIQEKKKNKKTKLKIWEGLKKSVQVVSVPMTACILKDKMKYVKYTQSHRITVIVWTNQCGGQDHSLLSRNPSTGGLSY